jgi:hypothetical protein
LDFEHEVKLDGLQVGTDPTLRDVAGEAGYSPWLDIPAHKGHSVLAIGYLRCLEGRRSAEVFVSAVPKDRSEGGVEKRKLASKTLNGGWQCVVLRRANAACLEHAAAMWMDLKKGRLRYKSCVEASMKVTLGMTAS